jgi:glycosyltransferase involved in cell wall biosynthesis
MISVVMPAFNEEAILGLTIQTVYDAMTLRDQPFEIVLVENGSTDATATLVDGLADRLPELRAIHLAEANYGRALKEGLLAATGEQAVIFDVDYYDLDWMAAALTELDRGHAAVIVASKRGEGAVDHRAWHRRLITAVFSTVLRLLFGSKLPDTHGIKVLDRAAVAPYVAACSARHDLFDSELILRVQRAGLHVGHLPIEVIERRPPRSSVLRRVPRTLVGLVRLRIALSRRDEPVRTTAR